ncbi:MAG: amino acid transporter [Gammaproteobacteria bacterium]|nr:amino acid transporter [Gammaproteobacteria bacterium]
MKFFLKGLLLSAGLIIAIGSQNAYVLKQGLLRNHVFYICLLCFLFDLILMTIGVFGVGSFIIHLPTLATVVSVIGAIFLFCYGAKAFLSAYRGKESLRVSDKTLAPTSLKRTVIITTAVSLLNPHVYLDTVIVIGGIANTFSLEQKVFFLIGAVLTSFIWFFSLGYGSKLLAPLFRKNITWRVLDVIIGCIMWWITIELVLFFLK